MFIVDSPDVDEPVESKKYCGGKQDQKGAPVFYGCHEFIPVPLQYKYDKKKEKGPNRPMHNDFKGRDVMQYLPVNGA
jgi:hypothetical protein